MKIKKTKALVKRAEGHAKADRYRQGFGYFQRLAEGWSHLLGGLRRNKPGQWKGCAIGCLATPLSASKFTPLGQEGSIGSLEDEFGIPRKITLIAEEFFEGLPGRSARTWPVRFAKALVAGSEPDGWEFDYIGYDANSTKDAKAFLRWLEDQPVRA